VSAPSARRSEGAGEARVTPSAVAPARPSESVIRRELDRLADSVGAPRADLDARAKTPSSAVRAAPVTLRGAPRAAPTGRPSARPAPRRAEHGPSLGAWLALALALVLVFVGLWLQRG
jgi:hypothetical protein